MKKYEAVFILDVRKVEDEGKAFSEEFEKLVLGMGGEMCKVDPLGRKQLAYEIKKKKAGAYWIFIFMLGADKVEEIRSNYSLDDRILRLMILNYDRPE